MGAGEIALIWVRNSVATSGAMILLDIDTSTVLSGNSEAADWTDCVSSTTAFLLRMPEIELLGIVNSRDIAAAVLPPV